MCSGHALPVATLALLMVVGCQSPPTRSPPHWVPVGGVQLDVANREILVSGHLNMASGLIELLACGPAGKTHESLLVLAVQPVDLQAALLLLGLEPGTDPRDLGVGQPSGPELDLWIEWEGDNGPMRRRAEHLIFHRGTRQTLPDTGWVFNGSQVINGAFMAENDQSLIATFWEPWAIVNLPLPCGGDDNLLEVFTDKVPPKGTPIRLRMSPRGQPPGDGLIPRWRPVPPDTSRLSHRG